MRGRKNQIDSNVIFFSASALLFAGFAFSEALISIGVGLIFLSFLFFRQKGEIAFKLKENRTFWLLVLVFALYLVGTLFSKDNNLAMYEINRNLFWLLIPPGVALSEKLSAKKYWNLLLIFVTIITLGTIITTTNYVINNNSNLLNSRSASFIRHSSLSIYSVFSIFILIYGKQSNFGLFKRLNGYFIAVWIVWIVAFLSIQKSLLGIIALIASLLFFTIKLIQSEKHFKYNKVLVLSLILIVLVPLGYIYKVYSDFYYIENDVPDQYVLTALGNSYTFNNKNKMKENGNYVHWYIAKDEFAEAWKDRFGFSIYDRGENGYRYYDTAIRYLTGLGLKKDANGIYSLSESDFINIKNGIPNHIFVDKKFSIYPRVYQSIWEMDVYLSSGNPNDKSFAQRIEFVKAAVYIIKNYPLGIGVGNYKLAYEEAYNSLNTQLKPEFRIEAHNQYLSYILKFGYMGFLLIIALIFIPVFKTQKIGNNILQLFFIMVGVVCLGDNFLELHTGLPFFIFFLSLILYHSPEV